MFAYDGTQRTTNLRYNFIKENKFTNKLRAGVSLANELTMDRASVGLHVGIYCFNKIKVPHYDEAGKENSQYKIENLLYNKLVMRFNITQKLFVVAEVKSHLQHVECAGVGFGWAMPDFGKRLKNPFERISFKKEDKEELRITGSER